MFILCYKKILTLPICMSKNLYCINIKNRQILPLVSSLKSIYIDKTQTNITMNRRMNIGQGMDYNGPPHMMNYNGPPRVHFNATRFDYPGPQMDYNYDSGSYRVGPRGRNYNNQQDDYEYSPMIKVHCDELREHHIGMTVEISGKVKKKQSSRFITLKDVNGSTQLVIPENNPYLVNKISNIPLDSYIVVTGTVSKRPKHQKNQFMNTGNVELIINRIINVQFNRFKNNQKTVGYQQTRNMSTVSQSIALTSEEYKRCNSKTIQEQFSKRTHNCSQLCAEHEGQSVVLSGWVEYNKGKFLQIKDGYGLVQIVVPASNETLNQYVGSLKTNTIVQVSGKVFMRPEYQRNKNLHSGEIEVHADSVTKLERVPGEEDDVTMDLAVPDSDAINVNSFTTRTHNCNELREEHVGQNVRLYGWLEYHRVGKFVIIRDGYGQTQLIIPDERKDIQQLIDRLPYESIIEATGVVTLRPMSSQTITMSTGKIEVVVNELKVVNEARQPLPFNIRDYNKAKEPLRMEHRYMDLRFPEMQRNMRVRSKFIHSMRDFLINQAEFVEVETPTLFRTTPGGAQEFIVPTRNPGHVYSLVQSPQQLKQMLMSGAIDRYFQVARCYRDEGARPDRQPEFTQLDIELTHTTVDGVISLIEKLLIHSWPAMVPGIHIPFNRITLEEAMTHYGSDKPDIRIPCKLIDCTDTVRSNEDLVKVDDFAAHAFVFKKPHNVLTVAIRNKYEDLAKTHPNTRLVLARFENNVDKTCDQLSKRLGNTIPKTLVEKLEIEPDSILFLAYGSRSQVLPLLGKLRVMYADCLEEKGIVVRNKEEMNFLWVVDFPLFEKDENGELASAHHPFTAPHPEDTVKLTTDPLSVRAQSYDLVLNGSEVGGGSIRIHDPKLQRQVLDLLKIDPETLKHFFNALSSGCPPHGGIALGLDRLLATMLVTNSIRDVIAFPKGVEGKDLLSGAPVVITEKDKKVYHLEFNEETKSIEKIEAVSSN